jgi:hypothetical protein
MRRFLATAFLVLIFGALGGSSPKPAHAQGKSDFSDWAVVVVAGDWRSHAGGSTEAFDNTRRDVTEALVKAGFDPANIRQYSLRPPHAGDDPKVVTTAQAAVNGFVDVAQKAQGGCLFYVSSHGSPAGAVFGPMDTLSPMKLSIILDEVCRERPTVVVISACFSGVFLPTIEKPNRMVMTAAREDRSSFGCSDKDRYPYFDNCILQSLPSSADFLVLSRKARQCVEKREVEEQLDPHSEPQTWIGSEAKEWIPFQRFSNRAPSG